MKNKEESNNKLEMVFWDNKTETTEIEINPDLFKNLLI